MVDPGSGPDEAALAVAARHALHDEELVAGFATGSIEDEGETARAQQLVERCVACRELQRDVAAIGGALRAGASFTAAAPRDFRLTADDARRLGGTVSARGFLPRLRGSLVGFANPLGASLTAMGLVGLLIGSTSFGGPASAPLSVDSTVTGSPVSPAENNPGAAQSVGPSSTGRSAAIDPGATSKGGDFAGGDQGEPGSSAGAAPAAWLFGGSLVLLAAGLILLGLALRRGRLGRAPDSSP